MSFFQLCQQKTNWSEIVSVPVFMPGAATRRLIRGLGTGALLLLTLPKPTMFAASSMVRESQPSGPIFRIADSKTSFSIPFELVDNRIFINVKLNGKGPFRFILDSGGYAQISLELAREVNLPLGKEGQGVGAGQNVMVARETKIAEMQIGALYLTNLNLGAYSYADARHVFGSKRFHGVIGLPVFQHLVVKVDYERQRLAFKVPSHFRYDGAGVVVPFELDRYAPIVTGAIDGIPARLTVDTGSRSSLLLRNPFIESHNLRTKYVPQVEAITGWGGGGSIRSQVTRTKLLRLGAVEFHNVVTFFSLQRAGLLATADDNAGLVGGSILKRFNITFDYSRKQLIFEKNHYHKPDTFDRAGMWLSQSADGKSFEIFDVVAGGPAANAGLKVGEKILVIDGRRIEQLVLPTVRERLKSLPPNHRLRLLVRSGDNQRQVVVVLKELV
ncbi:MAG TPA: aspartyl protease family protein [Pyrinomonadaceae bacterium]|jgi:hypothetical protein|nr:aspartyl protease family protein [Pyrinomonadaceae bacterium]